MFLANIHMVFLICFLKFASTTVFRLTFSNSLLHFFVVSSLAVGSLNRLVSYGDDLKNNQQMYSFAQA